MKPINPMKVCVLSFGVLALFIGMPLHSESIFIIDIPTKLPNGISYGSYSPPLAIGYSGLLAGRNYTLAGWLLITNNGSNWSLASTQWSSNTFRLDTTAGTNFSGTLWIVTNMDIFPTTTGYDWVFRLYDPDGTQVGFDQRFISPTASQPPVQAPIGNRTVDIGQTMGILLSATDTNNTVQYGATNLPAGITSFDTNAGQFVWTPTNAGAFGPVIFWTQDNGDGNLEDGEAVNFTVLATPYITNQPSSQVVTQRSAVSFSVQATSQTALSYQWRFNGTNIAGATANTFTKSSVSTNDAGGYSVIVSNAIGAVSSQPAVLVVSEPTTPIASEALSIAELQSLMDEYRLSFQVYSDISAGGNHFHAMGQLPDQYSAVGLSGICTNNPHSGATCIECTFTNISNTNGGGFYFMNGILYGSAPLPYFGGTNLPDSPLIISNYTGYDLTGATNLTFWARGGTGGEQVEFFVGGVGRDPASGIATNPFPDSLPRTPSQGKITTLTTNWRQFSIDLAHSNLTNVMGGFGWYTGASNNPNGATFYLDDIQYELSASARTQRQNEPRFIRSYRTLPIEPDFFNSTPLVDFDVVLRDVAYTYDNSVAILAFLADGSTDSLRRAELIGDAFVYAAQHDRTYVNGPFRTAYAPGDLTVPPGWVVNKKVGTVAMPGFYLENPDRYYEVENADVDTGNNAWATIALLALYKQTTNAEYLAAALNAANFIMSNRVDNAEFPGFLGGIYNAETTNSTIRPYKSTEHNLDTYAAFSVLYQITGQTQWLSGAILASNFVEMMWETNRGCYLAGTTGDTPDSRNQAVGQLPVDTQTWTILAIPDTLDRHPHLFEALEEYHTNHTDGFTGEDFNDDRDGVWFEGTAQTTVDYASVGNRAQIDQHRATLWAAQQIPPPYGDRMGTPAASHDGVTSGFSFVLFRRPHVGATSWNILAQKGFNPFYQTRQPLFLQTPTTVSNQVLHSPSLQMTALGEPGATVVLQSSTNLIQWIPVSTNTSAYGENVLTQTVNSASRAVLFRAEIK
jgi:hypothetical protein